jgi:hypothetical protein
MPDIPFLQFRDLFQFFRFLLAVAVTVYFTIITAQSLWSWYVWLASSDKYMTLLRRYLLVQTLRLRFKAFWGDVLICLFLGIAFIMLWRAQVLLDRVEKTLITANPTHVHRTT